MKISKLILAILVLGVCFDSLPAIWLPALRQRLKFRQLQRRLRPR